MSRRVSFLLAAGLVLGGCSADDTTAEPLVAPDAGADSSDAEPTGDGGADASDAADATDPGNATFVVRGSVGQIFVTHAEAGASLEVRDANGASLATGKADHLGSLVFRKLPPGTGYRVHAPDATPAQRSGPVDVLAEAASLPPPSFYAKQKLVPGNGYITTRDGTTLAVFVTLPGPADQGPYPTVVNYSGYDPGRPGAPVVPSDQMALCSIVPVLCDAPSDPSALIAAVAGYATVSVNMRGTGCSGGAYDYFETLQLLDGYDIVETVAAQDWVAGHKVGMVGLSYPGITQLFVAKTKPPSLAAITPLSVIGNTVTTLMPGGILNSGFALRWISAVYDKAAPYGQGWEQGRVDGGDTVCAENQLLHDQRVDNVDQAKTQAYYDPAIVDPLNPTKWADQIEVPVFLAGSWQDEQTGPFFTTLLDRLTSSPVKRFTMYNGVHPDGFAPQVLVEWKAFLDLYVAGKVPSFDPAMSLLVPELTKQVYGVSLPMPADRWTQYTSYADARAAWEAEPEVRVLLEDGATDPLGAPHADAELAFASWPPPETQARRWWFQPDGSLGDAAPTAMEGASSFRLDPTAGARGILEPGADLWDALPGYDWKAPANGDVVAFTTAPLEDDLVMVGTGSADFWIRSPVDDADLEVNLTEVRPDGQEMYVQSGWLRASFRALASTSTELWPEPSMLKGDLAPLPTGSFEKVRVPIAGFGHVFRKGSRVRIAIDTPGDSRAEWRFDLLPFPNAVNYDIAHSSVYPSSVALPVIAGATATTALPACPSLRGQPCRTFAETTNVPAAP